MSKIFVDASKHVVQETPAAKLFRKKLRFPGIFTYFNVETGQWVLAYWLHKKVRLADEIEDLGPAFEELTPEFIDMIIRCWGVVDWEKKKRLLLQKEKAEQDRMAEQIAEDSDRYKWAQNRLKGHNPYYIDSQFTGGEAT